MATAGDCYRFGLCGKSTRKIPWSSAISGGGGVHNEQIGERNIPELSCLNHECGLWISGGVCGIRAVEIDDRAPGRTVRRVFEDLLSATAFLRLRVT